MERREVAAARESLRIRVGRIVSCRVVLRVVAMSCCGFSASANFAADAQFFSSEIAWRHVVSCRVVS